MQERLLLCQRWKVNYIWTILRLIIHFLGWVFRMPIDRPKRQTKSELGPRQGSNLGSMPSLTNGKYCNGPEKLHPFALSVWAWATLFDTNGRQVQSFDQLRYPLGFLQQHEGCSWAFSTYCLGWLMDVLTLVGLQPLATSWHINKQ